MLYFGAKPPFSFERFLEMCEGVVSEEDIDSVKTSAMIDDREKSQAEAETVRLQAVEKWRAFDTALRNELVKIRATRKKVDPAKHMRGEAYADPALAHIAIQAHRNLSILEAEEALDRERWRFLEELSAGHYFDIDTLIVYANKLLILERWDRINSTDKSQALEKALAQEGAA